MQLVPEYVKPLPLHGGKLEGLRGPTSRTSWREALAGTVAAIGAERQR